MFLAMQAAAIPAGFRGVRGEVLRVLKQSQPLTAKELALALGMTANGLRRHLKELEGVGIVEYSRQVRGVGQPAFAYRLTESGERLFPSNYDVVLSQALETVEELFGSDAVVEIFRARWDRVAREAKAELDVLPLHQRTRRLAQLLSSMGYMAEAGDNGHNTLTERNCAIRALVARFPEICAAEERFISEVLGADVVRQSHIAKGANCCEYCITERAVDVALRPPADAVASPVHT
jgi:DeoR family transcriptional regulator, suf operon transcriptional repressor